MTSGFECLHRTGKVVRKKEIPFSQVLMVHVTVGRATSSTAKLSARVPLPPVVTSLTARY